jgi:hypothetical protein
MVDSPFTIHQILSVTTMYLKKRGLQLDLHNFLICINRVSNQLSVYKLVNTGQGKVFIDCMWNCEHPYTENPH